MIFVTSDLHGYPLSNFQDLLHRAGFGQQPDDFLFILGDVIDRNGDGGVETLCWLLTQPNVQLLLGNHEAFLLACDFLFETITESSLDSITETQMEIFTHWVANGAEPTITSLRALAARCPERIDEILEYLREAPIYEIVSVDSGDFILVHGGLGNFHPNKKLSQYTRDELIWTRPEFDEHYYADVMTILGHTPTGYYDPSYSGRIYKTPTWMDIDTGAADGGAPMILRLDDMQEFYV